jgi:hypothetical protein
VCFGLQRQAAGARVVRRDAEFPVHARNIPGEAFAAQKRKKNGHAPVIGMG